MKTAKKTKSILIAEDEKPVAHALELKLTQPGQAVKLVYNGETALEALEKDKYDLILLDIMMPKVDGFGVLEGMKKRGDKTPAIVLTNLSQPEDEQRVRTLGAKEFFVKSDTSIATVVARIKELLGS